MDEFIRVWCSQGPFANEWIHVRASSIAIVREQRGRLKSDTRRIVFVVGGEALRGTASISDLNKAGLPVPALQAVSRGHAVFSNAV
jgi:hypothetical protein